MEIIWIFLLLSLLIPLSLTMRSMQKKPLLGGGNFKYLSSKRDEVTRILESRFPYYKNLSDEDRKEFINRLIKFLSEKRFIGRQGFEINAEVCVLISASAIQLCFGLDNYLLQRYHTFLIFPDKYKNNITGQLHKGEAAMNGIIALSWNNFIYGIENTTDNINLGLHEMAHALQLTILMSNHHDLHLDEYMESFIINADNEFKQLIDGENKDIRSYGKTNIIEFFAVCIEYFFESPKSFKNKYPDLYKHIALLLNQDPANTNYRSASQLMIEPLTVEFKNVETPIRIKIYSHYPIYRLIGNSILILIASLPLGMSLQLYDMNLFAFSGLFIVSYLLFILYKVNVITFTESNIGIYNLFLSKELQYIDYKRILLIDLTEIITINHISKGRLQVFSTNLNVTPTKLNSIKELIKEKKIPLKKHLNKRAFGDALASRIRGASRF